MKIELDLPESMENVVRDQNKTIRDINTLRVFQSQYAKSALPLLEAMEHRKVEITEYLEKCILRRLQEKYPER